MEETLLYTPAEYRAKLERYADDTILFTDQLGSKRKINKYDHPTVVEKTGEQFRIFESAKPLTRFERNDYAIRRSERSNFYALVSFPEGSIEILVFRKKYAAPIYYCWLVLLIGAGIFTLIVGGYFFLVLILLYLMDLVRPRPLSKEKFRKFIITFLNHIGGTDDFRSF